MSFLTDIETDEREKPVNVASVPQRSPFRYPGGKTWFVPLFRRWIQSFETPPRTLVEPFAGGGIISLTAAFEKLTDRVVLVELDDQIAAVWETILGGEAEWLAKRIIMFDLSLESAKKRVRKETVISAGSRFPNSTQKPHCPWRNIGRGCGCHKTRRERQGNPFALVSPDYR